MRGNGRGLLRNHRRRGITGWEYAGAGATVCCVGTLAALRSSAVTVGATVVGTVSWSSGLGGGARRGGRRVYGVVGGARSSSTGGRRRRRARSASASAVEPWSRTASYVVDGVDVVEGGRRRGGRRRVRRHQGGGSGPPARVRNDDRDRDRHIRVRVGDETGMPGTPGAPERPVQTRRAAAGAGMVPPWYPRLGARAGAVGPAPAAESATAA